MNVLEGGAFLRVGGVRRAYTSDMLDEGVCRNAVLMFF